MPPLSLCARDEQLPRGPLWLTVGERRARSRRGRTGQFPCGQRLREHACSASASQWPNLIVCAARCQAAALPVSAAQLSAQLLALHSMASMIVASSIACACVCG